MATRPQLPNCYKCQHFFVTYQPTMPYGCRAYSFKGAKLPALLVYESSGLLCQAFAAKPTSGGSS